MSKNNNVHAFESTVKMSKYQPIDIKPLISRNWVENGLNNSNFKTYDDAYDDSPTNSSIINAFVSYTYGEGLIDKNGVDLHKYISKEDTLLIVQDFKKYGGYACQVVWLEGKVIAFERIAINKLTINYVKPSMKVDGFWYCFDWTKRTIYKPVLYPKYTGEYKNNNLEILYIKRPSSETFFPIPNYLSGIPWAQVEGELSNTAKNFLEKSRSILTIINYNNGSIDDEEIASEKADAVRKKVVGSENAGACLVSFNNGVEDSITADQLHPPELNQQNVFFTEEAERCIIKAHSAPPILFSGSNQGSGFSSNADEIEISTKALYRRHINPDREMILDGLKSIFKNIDSEIEPDFKDFEEETALEDNVDLPLDDKTLESQAQLKGSVGGVQSLLEVQASYAAGTTTYESAIAILDLIFGFNRIQAVRLLGNPQKEAI
jgi:hypothetical protein